MEFLRHGSFFDITFELLSHSPSFYGLTVIYVVAKYNCLDLTVIVKYNVDDTG
jgi:hypothetical protein